MQIKDHLYSERVPFLLFSWPFGKRYELVKIFFFPCQKKERGKNLLLLKYPLMHEFQVRTQFPPSKCVLSAEERVLRLKRPRLRSTDRQGRKRQPSLPPRAQPEPASESRLPTLQRTDKPRARQGALLASPVFSHRNRPAQERPRTDSQRG